MDFLQLILHKIHTHLKPEELATHNSEADLLTLINECSQLHWLFMNHILAAQKDKYTRLSVEHAQLTIIGLSNELYDYQLRLKELNLTKTQKNSITKFYSEVNLRLLEFYERLHVMYNSYFNFKEPLPHFSWKLRAAEINTNLNLFKLACADKVSVLVWDGFCTPYDEMLSCPDKNTPSFAFVNYLQSLLALCMKHIPTNETGIDNILIDELLKNNYNCPSFVNKLLTYYAALHETDELIDVQLMGWKRLLLQVNNLVLKDDKALYTYYPSVREQLKNGIEETIVSLELVKNNNLIKGESIPSIQTNLSLAQLAVMLRLMIEVGLIKSTNHAEFFRTAILLFKTRKAADVTPQSLKAKYYAPESSGCNIVKEYLFQMINQIRNFQ